MPLRSLACLAVLAVAAPAFAQAPGEVAPLAPAPAAAPKNPSSALGLSLGITLGGVAVMFTASSAHSDGLSWLGLGLMYVGPATGHWYAGEVGGAGLALRALAVLGAGEAIALAFGEGDCEEPGSCSNNDALPTLLLIASASAWLGSTIYDIATAPRAARSWNSAHGVVFTPTAMLSAGHTVPGVAVGFRF